MGFEQALKRCTKRRVVQTPFGARQVDAFVPERRLMVQVKSGREYLTTTGRGNNTWAIQRDRWLVQQGYTVEWVLEQGGSAPLRRGFREAGIRVHISLR